MERSQVCYLEVGSCSFHENTCQSQLTRRRRQVQRRASPGVRNVYTAAGLDENHRDAATVVDHGRVQRRHARSVLLIQGGAISQQDIHDGDASPADRGVLRFA